MALKLRQKLMTKEEIWKTVLGELEVSLSKANFNAWLKNTCLFSIEEGIATISVPNGFTKEWLENKYNKNILAALKKISLDLHEIRYMVGKPLEKEEKKKPDTEINFEAIDKERFDEDINKETNLNPKYTFESFIVGSSNELANAAALAITKNPGKIYNPLFIYGGVGLGKTHIIQAIGNKIYNGTPKKKVVYVPSERFTSEVIESIKNQKIEELKEKYKKYDLLIIDDIQFLAGKEKTQEIFFHIFNTLYSQNKQMILSSDRPPKSIPTLEERLRSRFEGGMVADIGYPEFELRLAILKIKAREKNIDFPEEVFTFLATNIQKNIRQLEGALNRLIAVSQMNNKIPDIKEVNKIFNNIISGGSYKKTTIQDIMKVVADFYGIGVNDIIRHVRKREIVRPRQIAMYLTREELKASFPTIGSKFGNRDHTTVIHAWEKIKKEEEADESLRQELALLKERVYQS